jgi:spore coat polysaccharide biosynthesis predicted glycosyltransferase SpsG
VIDVRPTRILFRVAAGPRIGFGHLVRAARLSDALRGETWISLRGARRQELGARGLRQVGDAVGVLDTLRPDALVLDTPIAHDAARWLSAARRRGIAVISMHDAGIAPVASDLAVDGSVAACGPIPGARRTLLGPRYAVIDRRAAFVRTTNATANRTILIALGGGPRRGVSRRLASAIAARLPDARILVAGGFVSAVRPVSQSNGNPQTPIRNPQSTIRNVLWLGPQDGLASLLAETDVAVVAGGLTLYESGAAQVPTVGVAVVPAQVPAIRAFAAAGASVDPRVTLQGTGIDRRGVDRVASAVEQLVQDSARRAALGRAGRRLIDGGGAERVATAVGRLLARSGRAS